MTNKKPHPFYVLIAAAGTGTRMEQGTPKQYRRIGGKLVLRHTIEQFLGIPGLEEIKVIIHPDHIALYEEAIQGVDISGYIIGNRSRKLSVYNGLKSFSKLKKEDVVLIHDAARPNIHKKDIMHVVQALQDHKAVSLGVPVSDTLTLADSDTNISEAIPRDNAWALQTPQGFQYGCILEAHEKFKDDDHYTDDTGLVRDMGVCLHLVEGSRQNFKITTQDDFTMMERILSGNQETRTGIGYDVHRFEDQPSKTGKIRLGGIDIDHPYVLAGHSDADVGLHALTDAILGAIGKGDIGQHFPPSDQPWKNADSALFLEKACSMVQDMGGNIVNLDLTFICEAPKIGPHVEVMRARIADIVDLDEARINIKATTTEKLGFTGREEGIAAQAVATVTVPQ